MSRASAPTIDIALDFPPSAISRRRRVMRHDSIREAQRRHFLMFDVVPAAAAIVAVPVLWHIGLSWVGVALFAIMWVLNLIGIEVGFHRLFSHGAFEASPRVRAALVILGSMGAQGPVVSWASNHRHHHHHSDTPEDTHTPHAHDANNPRARLRAFLHAHLIWKWAYPYPSPSHYTPGLLRDPVVIKTSRHYTTWIVLGLVAPAIIGGLVTWSLHGALEGLITGGILRLVLGQHATWCINSLCHLVGSRPFYTGDRSTNNAWLALPTLGGSWHNNHHAFPTTASNQLMWWQLDPCYWVIATLARLGLVTDVKLPTADAVRAKRAVAARRTSLTKGSVMSPALFILSLLGFVVMFALPKIFFRSDGTMNLRWWLTGAPFGLAANGLWLTWAGISPRLVPGGDTVAIVLDVVGMLVIVAAMALIAATIATHRVPLALWHQDGDQNAPVHIVTYGPYGWVRHPFYTSFILLLVGSALIARDVVTLAALPLGLLSLDWTARNEEKKLLASSLGDEYGAYRERTGRFVPHLENAWRS